MNISSLHLKLPYFKIWKNDKNFILKHFNIKCINDFSWYPVTGKDYYVIGGFWDSVLSWGWKNIIKTSEYYPFIMANYSLYNVENAFKIEIIMYDDNSLSVYLKDVSYDNTSDKSSTIKITSYNNFSYTDDK